MVFSGNNVLVTGASRGIGAEVARVLASFGLKVWINYRSKPEIADALLKEIRDNGGEAAVVHFDACCEKEFKEGIETILSSDGGLSYLVNNAGITRDKLTMKMTVEDFNAILEANLTSSFIGSREALKIMRKAGFGSVVNISSIVGEMGNLGQANYAASKAGMIAMTKSIAREGGSKNVRFNCITPGFIESDMTASLKEEVQQSYIKNIPLNRFGKPREVAMTVAFLLSDYSSYITGEVLRVNGGLLM